MAAAGSFDRSPCNWKSRASNVKVAGCEGGSGDTSSGGDFVVRFRLVEGVRETAGVDELARIEHADIVLAKK